MQNYHKENEILKHYLVTESGIFTSFDPLDADATNNLPAIRMLYLTPLEMFQDYRKETLRLWN